MPEDTEADGVFDIWGVACLDIRSRWHKAVAACDNWKQISQVRETT